MDRLSQSSIALQQPSWGLDRPFAICRSARGVTAEGADRAQQETLVLDKPEQLKALGHPLRVRVLEMLGQEGDWQLTNRELAARLGVDPGHLHFHVRMLLKAGLIELADTDRRGREKPYRSVAKTFRVSPELLAAGGASDLQAAMLDQVQRAHALYSTAGSFRSAQVEVKLTVEQARELMSKVLEQARELENEEAEKLVLTMFAHPPASQD
jgi:DNA-binding transcriptional ArsR family regulator